MKISVFYDHIIEEAKNSQIPIEEVLAKVKSFGITGVECSYDSVKGSEAKMKKLLGRYGLEIVSIFRMFNSGYNEDTEEATNFVDLAYSMGVKQILVVPGLLKKDDIGELAAVKSHEGCAGRCKSAPITNRMLDFVNSLCSAASDKNITVVLEDFDNNLSPFATSCGMNYFFNNIPLLKCAFDTGNFLYSAEDELAAFDILKDKITHVHCKDRSLTPVKDEKPLICVDGTPLYPSPVGYGCIKMKELMKLLQNAGYDGCLSIEHYGSQTQLDYIEKSAGWLRQII